MDDVKHKPTANGAHIVLTYLMKSIMKITSIALWVSSWMSMFFQLTTKTTRQYQWTVFGVTASTC